MLFAFRFSSVPILADRKDLPTSQTGSASDDVSSRFRFSPKPFMLAVIALLALGLATPLQAQINVRITLDGRNGERVPELPAGDYAVTVIGGPWNNLNGEADPFREVGWLADYDLVTSSGARYQHGTGKHLWPHYAIAASQPVHFSLRDWENVRFYIYDPIPDDNTGRLVLNLQGIPQDRLLDALPSDVAELFLRLLASDLSSASELIRQYIRSGNWSEFLSNLMGRVSAAGRASGVVTSTGAAWLDDRNAANIDAVNRAVREARESGSEIMGTPPSQVSLAFRSGSEHLSLRDAMAPDPGFLGGAGRQSWTRFFFQNNRPLIRVVQRHVTRPAGETDIRNAQEVVLRLRVQNFSNIVGCSATIAATLNRN